MASDDGSDQPRVKRMRKGTKSCAECRRRKIKCIFEPHRADVCRDCFERGSECIDQEHADSKPKTSDSTSLKGRVSQLEDLVRTLVNKLDENNGNPKSPSRIPARPDTYLTRPPMSPPTTTASPASQCGAGLPVRHNSKADLGIAPVIGLFDNAVVTPQGGWNEEARTATAQDLPDSLAEQGKDARLRRMLLALLPSKTAIRWIVRNYGSWWEDWFYMMPEMLSSADSTLEAFMETSIAKGDAVTLAYALLNLAMCLQKMPDGEKAEGLDLPLPPYQLSDKYVAEINRLILSDDEIVGTYNGIGCLVIYGKFMVDGGRPRKAWLAHRRAITFGQLLNLHRKSGRAVASPDCSVARKNFLWIDLYMIDQLLALLLGQPYTIQRNQFDMDDAELRQAPLELSLMVRIAFVASRIVDRNLDMQSKSLDDLLSVTKRLDEDLDEVERSIPAQWCDGAAIPHQREQNNRIFIRFMHHQIRVFIHMPFMIRSQTDNRDNRLSKNRDAALQASRKMLDMYRVLRTTVFLRSHICKALDFQAFTAAMLLVLNLLGYSSSDPHDSWDDWKTVESTIELLRTTTHEIGGKVSAQCVRTLELFTSCHRYAGTDPEFKGSTAQVTIPFFGTLTVAPGQGLNLAGYKKARSKDSASLPTPSTESDASGVSPGYLPLQNEPFIDFNSYADPLPMDYFGGGDMQQNFGDQPTSTYQDPLTQPWTTMFNMDLDHDWSWYLGNGDNGLDKVQPP